ncbi:hypothetical protein PAEPH01_0758 [Pancytospora epiphaga]|nr:hypothetical protein PAEPH01_0758 [Pancytospora epiphaga]
MIKFSYFSDFKEIAIVFSEEFRGVVQSIYDECQRIYPDKVIYLVTAGEVICPIKSDEYESYIVVGIACPLHKFKNAVFYKIEIKQEYADMIASHKGPVLIDSIYSYRETNESEKEEGQANSERMNGFSNNNEDLPLLIVTESQQILDYYCFNYENIVKLPNKLILKDRIRYLMKESINGSKIGTKKLIGIVFTSLYFENTVDDLYKKLNSISRAYKILLKDISYERLISIEHLDCLVLVDCPVFQCNISLHIPVLSPFSVESGLKELFGHDSLGTQGESTELSVSGTATELMVQREFKGVIYSGNDEDDMEIHKGKDGIAARYDSEHK